MQSLLRGAPKTTHAPPTGQEPHRCHLAALAPPLTSHTWTPDIAAKLTPLTPGTSTHDSHTPRDCSQERENPLSVPVSEQKVTARGCHAARILVPPKHLGEPSDRHSAGPAAQIQCDWSVRQTDDLQMAKRSSFVCECDSRMGSGSGSPEFTPSATLLLAGGSKGLSAPAPSYQFGAIRRGLLPSLPYLRPRTLP